MKSMPRLRTVSIVAVLMAVAVFCGYSIPVYFRLLAHQPGRDALHPTSFPPSYAFFLGGYYSVITFVAIYVAFLLIRLVAWVRGQIEPKR